MSPATEPMERLRQQANDSYWNSEETVEQLAARLGISRKAVYSSVEPMASGAICVHCDRELLFANRTSRAAGLAACPVCERETDVGSAEQIASPAIATERLAKSRVGSAHAVPVHEPNGRWTRTREDLGAVAPERAAKIGSAAALGVALGAAAAKVIRSRG
jgi:DNA-binding transcriptional regulator LsrR (DeoR family)